MKGGKRIGAGRKNKYGCKSVVLRVPENMVGEIHQYISTNGARYPLYSCSVSAGFPSPADDHIESKLDLNSHLIKNPSASFFLRVSGESMIGAGINEGDLLVVDRSIPATNGKIVIAAVSGELTVKRLHIGKNGTFLLPENPAYSPITVSDDTLIWGVVTYVVHKI